MLTSLATQRGGAVAMGLVGCATIRAASDQIARLRKNPGLPPDRTLSPGFLKNSDDQTVLALAAICRAMDSMDRPTSFFENWGVVAAATLFGRASTLRGLLNFRREGAWGVNPHMIPHHSLHAVSGTITQALQIHGPNFGIGGGPNGVAEAFIAAATMISENTLPGLWVVLTGHERECLPTEKCEDGQPPIAHLAAAVALEPPNCSLSASGLYISGVDDAPEDWPEMDLHDFLNVLESSTLAGRWSLPGCGWVVLDDAWETPP